MKDKLKNICKGFVIAGLAVALSYGCSGKPNTGQEGNPPVMHLGKNIITDVKEQIEIGQNFVDIKYPAHHITYIMIEYNDFDNDSSVDNYHATLWYSGGAAGTSLTSLYNKKFAKERDLKGRDIMSDKLQDRINEEYKSLREKYPRTTHLYKNLAF